MVQLKLIESGTRIDRYNRDLPEGAKRVTGTLREAIYGAHIRNFQLWKMNGRIPAFPGEILTEMGAFSSKDMLRPDFEGYFNSSMKPYVAGYEWHAGYRIGAGSGSILFYQPWISDCIAPETYTLGDVSGKDLEKIIRLYVERMMLKMSEAENQLNSPGRLRIVKG